MLLSSKLVRRIVRPSLPLWLGIAATAALVACKKQPVSGSSAVSGSSSVAGSRSPTAASASGLSGSCETYVKRLCEKAGAESNTCQSIKTSFELLPEEACVAGLKKIDDSFKKIASAGASCEELTKRLCASVGEESCKLVTTQTKEFPPERCKLMLEHFSEVVASLKRMELQQQPLTKELAATIEKGTAPSFGPADAKVRIVEFSDFQCPYCARAADVVHQIKTTYGTRVRFVFRQFPLSGHPLAREAAEAALAANAQGKFWEYHDRLFHNPQQLDRAGLEAQAKELGLNLNTFKKALDDHQYGSAVESDLKLGEQVAVDGTPTMFLNGARVENPTSFEGISKMIEAALNGQTPG